MKETILVIDDDDSMHIVLKKMLSDEFALLQARNAQEGIDTLSKNQVDLIMTDIHMPGLSGLEFLESLIADADKKRIPVLIITGKPTVEKEQKALDLGASDFIRKQLFSDDQKKVMDRVRSKIITNFDYPEITEKLNINTKKLGNILMSESVNGDYFTISRKFCVELLNTFQINFISQWSVIEKNVSLLMGLGDKQPLDYGAKDLVQEEAYKKLLSTKEPYMCNHVAADSCGIMAKFSEEQQLPAEIAIPLFALSEKEYLQNNREIPEGTEIFGLLFFKRNKLFTTKEFMAMRKLFGRASPVFWRLYKEI
ncbi:response regulator [Fodinibius sp.]|uniref:response regulator n=1 Tax=Fodinibius sp. TaxID=1872440 RepID=UPI002ACD3E1E|nr:response regulator [Fodinibius sp.]MDZ7658908.1 response regulator [Fodinibius sp.]